MKMKRSDIVCCPYCDKYTSLWTGRCEFCDEVLYYDEELDGEDVEADDEI